MDATAGVPGSLGNITEAVRMTDGRAEEGGTLTRSGRRGPRLSPTPHPSVSHGQGLAAAGAGPAPHLPRPGLLPHRAGQQPLVRGHPEGGKAAVPGPRGRASCIRSSGGSGEGQRDEESRAVQHIWETGDDKVAQRRSTPGSGSLARTASVAQVACPRVGVAGAGCRG